ncbi:MAG: UDP-N-acetylglucosamine--N-acetylmuramyl-(pentapeptide) pyrophosphoryl-undecaprenol N-acetylglucosamine transferase [Clostridia bacterium]|nr:UDP-N-acetylglucosamine--N-acetylmuramyl-(pentapeptide) pyrophosphoryl-undecaprenol N-acetylglucosamine transferase [Clostridia bacterium]
MKKILFTGGGSAGHVIPNLALINELLSDGKTDVCYMGTNGIEKSIVAAKNIPFYEIRCPKLIRGGGIKGLWKNLKIPRTFSQAVKQAEKGLRLFQPDLVFSKGGYVALPVLFAARKMRIPCLTHESDLSAGLANKLAAKKCHRVLTSFPETAEKFKNGKYTGAPVRREIFSANRAAARQKYGIPPSQKVLLVLGGGSGSVAINQAVRAQIKKLTEFCFVLHICGKGNRVESTLKNYAQEEFVSDIGEAYACADLVLSRAGAGAIFEILALKKPSVLVPLAGATRGDQRQNAEYFRKRGLCRVLPQDNLQALADEIERAFADHELSLRLQEHVPENGTKNVLLEIEELLRL